ncbi:MAG TPA: T9SS type A sorting domain-containing protein [Prolixibacteraceae bacterium]|nr:T9SS type A sorting domain-containing protein [Prolixibacteraceae bacterium]
MKKFYALTIIVLFANVAFSQAYISFPVDSAQWNIGVSYDASYGNIRYYNYQLFLDGDTVLNGNEYSKLYHSQFGYIGGLREVDKNIYIFPSDTQIGDYDYSFPSDTSENLLYTFDSLAVGDTIVINSYNLIVHKIDSVEFDGIYHKRYNIYGSPVLAEYWIEGIGSNKELLANYLYPEFEVGHATLCYKPNPYVTYFLFPWLPYCAYPVGIKDMVPEQITISPNPVTDYLRISSGELHNSTVILSNSFGQAIFSTTFQSDIVIDASGFKLGFYFISITTEDKIMMAKFLKI